MSTPQNEQAEILLVDDTPANLHVLSAILSKRGYRVRAAPNGQGALRTARKAPPDLILLDIQMPDMDGYAVCRELKSDEQTCHVPVIFISARDDTLDKVEAFRIGGVDYITKPFQIEEVLARVENHLVLHQQRAILAALRHPVGELLRCVELLQQEGATERSAELLAQIHEHARRLQAAVEAPVPPSVDQD